MPGRAPAASTSCSSARHDGNRRSWSCGTCCSTAGRRCAAWRRRSRPAASTLAQAGAWTAYSSFAALAATGRWCASWDRCSRLDIPQALMGGCEPWPIRRRPCRVRPASRGPMSRARASSQRAGRHPRHHRPAALTCAPATTDVGAGVVARGTAARRPRPCAPATTDVGAGVVPRATCRPAASTCAPATTDVGAGVVPRGTTARAPRRADRPMQHRAEPMYPHRVHGR